MLKKLFLSLLLYFILAFPTYAVRTLPSGVYPESIEGEATGTFPELFGSGTLTFINTGGEARLVTVCDKPPENGAHSVTCTGIDITGTFSGGPNGIAVFPSSSGEIKLPLNDGKVFRFTSSEFSMDFTVTDPSIFDDWIESPNARDSGARVSELSGQVEIACPPDLEAWDVMKMGRIIYVDCHLKTGEDSKAVISFSDWTTFEMRAESEIVIDTPPEKDSKLKLLAGNIWANVKKMVKDGTMEVHMSQAVAGIKGTRFILTETGMESKIEVEEGTVVFTSTVNGQQATVSAGESITATSTGLSEKTLVDNPTNLIEKKSVEIPNANTTMIYLASASVVMLIMIVIGMQVLKAKKVIS